MFFVLSAIFEGVCVDADKQQTQKTAMKNERIIKSFGVVIGMPAKDI